MISKNNSDQPTVDNATLHLRPPSLIDRFYTEVRSDTLTDQASLGLYATDASMYQMFAAGRGRTAELRQYNKSGKAPHKAGFAPAGQMRGTNLTGQSIDETVILDVSRLNGC